MLAFAQHSLFKGESMTNKCFTCVICLTLLLSALFVGDQAFGKLKDDEKKQCEERLADILMNKQLTAKVTFPASKDGADLHVDGTWDNKKVTRSIKDKGIGIEIGDPVTVTTVKLKGKHIEIHLNGGGYGTFGDKLLSDFNIGSAKRGAKQAGGSRINLRFGRDITADDIKVESLSKWLEPLVDTAVLYKDIAQKNIPEEFKEASEKGEILVGMDKETVFAIKGKPFEQKLDVDVNPPVEKWQYKLEGMKIMLVTFEGGKVTKVQIF